ncbi:MAG: sigma-54 dependent transcriptional regulator [candidate division NC10 bacterium]|nr:sigma-54 dependent transcriptional regulator [candidate division NC10 bacterium]
MAHILVVDDKEGMREFFEIFLRKEGYQVSTAARGEEALELARAGRFDLAISDIKMPGMDGISLLKGLRELDPQLPVIMITAYPTIESSIEAMRLGAYDYLIKPFSNDEIRIKIAKALEASALRRENLYLRDGLKEKYRFDGIVGKSSKMVALYELMEKVSRISSTLLIEGESGTGKELVAKAIHYNGPRSEAPFVAINCGAIPDQLLESELFGHVKGSFTGAISNKVGLFEVANRGTIFLDEVAELSLPLQVKLLRVLADQTFRRVGGTEDIQVDVRVIAASNRSLEEAMRTGAFREDLYYRIKVIGLTVPPLRERREDIPLLCQHFLSKFTAQSNRPLPKIRADTMSILTSYGWPGNVRELENVMERAVALETSPEITPESLPPGLAGVQEGSLPPLGKSLGLPEEGLDLDATLADWERELLLQSLQRARGEQKKAASLLGLSLDAFRYRLKKHQIEGEKGKKLG